MTWLDKKALFRVGVLLITTAIENGKSDNVDGFELDLRIGGTRRRILKTKFAFNRKINEFLK